MKRYISIKHMEKFDIKKWPETLNKWADKSWLGKITRLPLIREATDLTGMAIGGVVNHVRGGIESVMRINHRREAEEQRMNEKTSQVGGNLHRIPQVNSWQRPGGLIEQINEHIEVDDNGVLLNAVYLDKAPCRIETRITGADGKETIKVYERGETINNVLAPIVTTITDRQRFHGYIIAKTEGRENLGGARGPFGLLRKVAKRAVQYAGTALTFGGVAAGAFSLLGAGLAKIGLPSAVVASKLLLGNFLTHGLSVAAYTGLSATGVGLAALVGGVSIYAGYKLAKGFLKLIPKNKPSLQYMANTRGTTINKESMETAISKKTRRTLAKHTVDIGPGERTVQEGDLVLGVDTPVGTLGLLIPNPAVPPVPPYITGFYNEQGQPLGVHDVLPAGTVIPHGTLWGHNGEVPPATEYRDVKPFTGTVLPVGTLKESISIDNENGAILQGMLTLRTGVSLPFDYTDLQKTPPVTHTAGEYSPPGAVINIRVLPKGTIIPAGSIVRHEVVSEGEFDINTTTAAEVTQSDVAFPHTTRLRRDIDLGITENIGVLIPMTTQEEIIIAGEKFARESFTVQTLSGREIQKDNKRFKLHQPKDGKLTAGSQFPTGTILPARARLTKHQTAGADRLREFPVKTRFTNDIALRHAQDLFTLAQEVCGAGNEQHFRLRLGDNMVNHIGYFIDPDTGRPHQKDHVIPAGTCIPAQYNGANLAIRTGTVIPGGSEIYDARTRKSKETLTELGTAAVGTINAVTIAALVTGRVPSDYRTHLETLVPALTQIRAAGEEGQKQLTAIEQAINSKLVGAADHWINTSYAWLNDIAHLDVLDPAHHAAANSVIGYLQASIAASNLQEAKQTVDELTEPQKSEMLIRLQRMIIDRIAASISNTISTQINAIRTAPGVVWTGTQQEKRSLIMGRLEYRHINAAINVLTNNVFPGPLETSVSEYATNYKRQLGEDLSRKVAEISQL